MSSSLLGRNKVQSLSIRLTVTIPLNHYASKVIIDTQENLMTTRDERTGVMNEILGAIRMIKFMAWERKFQQKVSTIRTRELHYLKRNYLIEVGSCSQTIDRNKQLTGLCDRSCWDGCGRLHP